MTLSPLRLTQIPNYRGPKGGIAVQVRGILRPKTQPPGTKFLDAETKRQKSCRKNVNACRDQNPGAKWPIKAAVEDRLPRGIGIERLRDPPTEWSGQFEALGLNPE